VASGASGSKVVAALLSTMALHLRDKKESTMPTSSELALQQRCQQIVTSPVLSPEQKRHFLAL
jgi:hypothetical protein